MLSSRTRWYRDKNRLARLLEERHAAGKRVLDLTETNPTRAQLVTPQIVLDLLAHPASQQYHPTPQGLLRTREAVAADYAHRGVMTDASRLVLTSSTSEAYAFVFKLLCDPGDTVLVPRPSYPLFEYLARLENVSLSPYALSYDGQWHLSLSAIEAALKPRTRGVVVVHPNHPTGSFVKQSEAEGLLDLCARRSVPIIADEVFADYGFGADTRRFSSFAGDGPVLAFSLGGLSKSCGLPQLKLAWIAVSGPRPIREEALARLEIVSDTYLSVATPIQVAAPDILQHKEDLQQPLRSRVARNLQFLRRCLTSQPPATLLDLEGGWSAILQVPATVSEEDRVCRLLVERGVLVQPGYFFDFDREAFVVLSLLTPPRDFERGVQSIVESLVL